MATPPVSIGRYQVVRPIGQGGMGSLYLVWDPRLERQIAIKILKDDDEQLRERFSREARAAARLRHPHIVTIFDVGDHDGQPFIAMEFVQGETLADVIRHRNEMPLARKVELIEALCDGLGFAHKAGIVHRDIKPANIMVDHEGALKILDFGIARAIESAGMTQAGMLIGTLNYMSPEQVAGLSVDHRSDIFAVGTVFYELLAYRQAFPGTMLAAILSSIVHEAPEPLDSLVGDLHPEIVRIVDKAIAKNPQDRYQDLQTMRRELTHLRMQLETGVVSTHGIHVTPSEGTNQPPDSRFVTSSKPAPGLRQADADGLARRRATQIQTQLDQARSAFALGAYSTCIDACEQALILNPDDADSIELLDQARTALEARLAQEMLEAEAERAREAAAREAEAREREAREREREAREKDARDRAVERRAAAAASEARSIQDARAVDATIRLDRPRVQAPDNAARAPVPDPPRVVAEPPSRVAPARPMSLIYVGAAAAVLVIAVAAYAMFGPSAATPTPGQSQAAAESPTPQTIAPPPVSDPPVSSPSPSPSPSSSPSPSPLPSSSPSSIAAGAAAGVAAGTVPTTATPKPAASNAAEVVRLRTRAREQYDNNDRVGALATAMEAWRLNPKDSPLLLLLQKLTQDAQSGAMQAREDAENAGRAATATQAYKDGLAAQQSADQLKPGAVAPDEVVKQYRTATTSFEKASEEAKKATTAAAAAAASVAATPVPPPPNKPTKADEEALIRAALRQYEQAYEAKDADAVSQIFSRTPAQVKELRARYLDNQSQKIVHVVDRIVISDTKARVECSFTMTAKPKVGDELRLTGKTAYEMQKVGDHWRIVLQGGG